VQAIFESPEFSCSGYGGDFVLPGCVEYQHLHQASQLIVATSLCLLQLTSLDTFCCRTWATF